MNELGYLLIVDKQVKRKIDIVNALMHGIKPIKIADLAQICSTSTRTISSELKKIASELPENATLDYINTEGVILNAENVFLVSNYIDSLLEGNPLYHVVESIFENQQLSIEDYAFATHISDSTMRIYLNLLKKILESYFLELQISPFITIIGNEVDIRFFFFQYFRHAHDSSLVHPSEEQYEMIQSLMINAQKKYATQLNLDYYRLSNWLMIFEKRIETGHLVTIDSSIKNKHDKIEANQYLRAALKKYYENNKRVKKIPEDELVFTTVIKLDSIVYENGENIYSREYKHILNSFDHLLEDFSAETPHIGTGSKTELESLVRAYLTNTYLLSDLSILFQRATLSMKEHAKKYYLKTFHLWEKILSKNLLEVFPTAHFIEDIAVNLTILCIAYLRLHEVENTNVLVSLTGTPTSLMYYKSAILNIVPNGITPYFIFNKPLNNYLIHALDIDLCIYNYELDIELTCEHSIRIPNAPTELEWIKLLPELLPI